MKIAINGFGRIGRTVLKIALERPGIEIGAINDIGSREVLAHLLKHDSTYGVYANSVVLGESGLRVGDADIPVLCEPNPANLPWKEMGIDVVIEASGKFLCAEGADGGYLDHLNSGARQVLLSASVDDESVFTIVPGVNDDEMNREGAVFSAGCGATQCLALLVKILHEGFGVEHGLMTASHAFTNETVVLDGPKENLREARSGVLSVVPVASGVPDRVGRLFPDVEGKLIGNEMVVPIPVGGFLDLVVHVGKDVTVGDVNDVFREASESSLQGILAYSEAPLVSADLRGNSHSAVFDGEAAMVLNGRFVKVLAWYDNEFAFSTRLVDMVQRFSRSN